MKLDRARASLVSIVVAVLTMVPILKAFPILMRGSMHNTCRVVTGCPVHYGMVCSPASSFNRCLVRGVMSGQLHLLSLVTLQISLHNLLNSLHSRLASSSRSGNRRIRNNRGGRNSNSKRRTCLLTLGNLNFEKGMSRGPFCLLGHRSRGGRSRHDDRCRCCWWI